LEFDPGTVMTEADLALSLGGVSRTPVRESRARLVKEGWMVDEGRSLRIAQVGLRDIGELFSLRVLLESEGVGLAVHRIDEYSQLEELEELGWGAPYDPADGASITEFIRRNTEFHARLTGIGGNAWLTTTLRDVLEQLERVTHIALAHGAEVRPAEWMHEHEDLLGAVIGGNESEARAVAAAQASQAKRRVVAVLRASPNVNYSSIGEKKGDSA
jgi:DNA-binding GntR family transcriptional regulator